MNIKVDPLDIYYFQDSGSFTPDDTGIEVLVNQFTNLYNQRRIFGNYQWLLKNITIVLRLSESTITGSGRAVPIRGIKLTDMGGYSNMNLKDEGLYMLNGQDIYVPFYLDSESLDLTLYWDYGQFQDAGVPVANAYDTANWYAQISLVKLKTE